MLCNMIISTINCNATATSVLDIKRSHWLYNFIVEKTRINTHNVE